MSQELFDEAIRLEDEGQHERALGVWRQLAETNPTRNVFLRLAHLTQNLGLKADAESAFQRALSIDNRSAPALKGLGILAIHQMNYEAAEGYLRKCCEIEEDPGGWSLLGVALRHVGKDLEAQEAYRRAIRIDSRYEEAYFNLGVHLRVDRPSEAETLFREAIRLDPNFACAHRELGWVLGVRLGDPEAEVHLRKAIELDPCDGWAHIYLGTCFWKRADADSAMAEFRIAAEIKPEWAVPLSSMGNLYEHAYKDFDKARSFFEQALQVEPDNEAALQGLHRLSEKRGKLDGF